MTKSKNKEQNLCVGCIHAKLLELETQVYECKASLGEYAALTLLDQFVRVGRIDLPFEVASNVEHTHDAWPLRFHSKRLLVCNGREE